MKEVQDRVVQFSNRYKLTNAETGEVLGTFDFDEVTGTVQQVGTEIDKELFDSIANDLAARVKLSGGELAGTIVTFSDIGGTAANVASGDTSATLWGKVKNWFSRLKALAFKDKISNTDVAENAAIAQSKVNGLESALAGKQPTITGAATSITNNNLTASRVVVSDESGKIDVSAVTATELNYISGADRNIQNQIEDIKDGTTPPVQATRAQQDGDGANIVQTYAKKNGSYSELTAGKAVRLSQSVKMQATNSAGGQLGWFKLATVSGAKLAAINGNRSYSATLLINGINEPALSFGGIVEIDCRIESSQIVTDSNRVQPKILCGGLREEYICAVPNTETNELDVYFLINSSYAGYSVTVIDEGYTRLMQPSETAITLAGTFYNAEAPSGAVYAVNVNSAAYDADGNDIAETYANQNGNYPNLTAGSADRLSRRLYIGVGTGTPGWYKVGSLKVSDILSQSSATNTTSSFSMLFLVTGLNANGINQTGVAHSGVFELECRMITGAFADGYTNIKILAGDIRAEDYCYAMDTAGSEITLYCNLGGTYMATDFCILSEQYGIFATKAFTFDGTFESAEMPSGGTVGINVSRAAYDAAGNDISETYAKQIGTYPSMTVGNAGRAEGDAAGNDIQTTYATKTEVNAKYTKPATGIPESDLSEGVQTKLNSDSILGVGNPIQTTLTDTPKTGDTFTAESANFNTVPGVNEYVLCAIKLDGTASYKAQAPFVVVAQCTEVSADSLTMTVRSIYSAPPLHFMSSREGNTSIGASYITGSNLFDRTPINGETFECLVKIDGAFYVQTCRVTSVAADNVVNYYTLEAARQIGSAPSVKLYAHHISMVLTTVAGSGRLSMTIIDSTSAAYNSVAGVAGRLSVMGLNTSAESHDATGYVSYNEKAYIIYGIYAATITSITVNCYNAEDHQDAPTGIDSATVTDTVIAIN